jgi:hypothetical protein
VFVLSETIIRAFAHDCKDARQTACKLGFFRARWAISTQAQPQTGVRIFVDSHG